MGYCLNEKTKSNPSYEYWKKRIASRKDSWKKNECKNVMGILPVNLRDKLLPLRLDIVFKVLLCFKIQFCLIIQLLSFLCFYLIYSL